MHINKKGIRFFSPSRLLFSVLAISFWGMLVYAFDTPFAANATLISALVHELGHTVAFTLLNEASSAPVPRLFGFKIYGNPSISYKNEIICAAAGPLANVALCIIALPILTVNTEAYRVFAVISIATGVSNLLPVKGYDGYRIICSAACLLGGNRIIINIIDAFSFLSMCVLTLVSLLFIAEFNEGYWIFTVFFCSLLSEIKKCIGRTKNEIN